MKVRRSQSSRAISAQDKIKLSQGVVLPQFSAFSAISDTHGQQDAGDKNDGDERSTFKAAAMFKGSGYGLDRNRRDEDRLKEEAEAADEITKGGGHIILAVSAVGEWQSVIAFLRPLRSPYLPSVKPVVCMAPEMAPKEMWDMFTDVAYIMGHPSKPADLLRAGCDVADTVVVIAGAPEVDERSLIDANVVITATSFEAFSAGSSLSNKEGTDRPFAVYELLSPGNLSLLHPPKIESARSSVPIVGAEDEIQMEDVDRSLTIVPPAGSPMSGSETDDPNDQTMAEKMARMFAKKAKDERKHAIRSIDTPHILQPHFASGRVFTPTLLGSLFAQAFYTPGILELMDALVLPSRRSQQVYPWFMPIPDHLVGRTYSELFELLVNQGAGMLDEKIELARSSSDPDLMKRLENAIHALPLGLYRDSQSEESVGYVYTCPAPDTIITEWDKVYVVASKEWGHSMDKFAAERDGMRLARGLAKAQHNAENSSWVSRQMCGSQPEGLPELGAPLSGGSPPAAHPADTGLFSSCMSRTPVVAVPMSTTLSSHENGSGNDKNRR